MVKKATSKKLALPDYRDLLRIAIEAAQRSNIKQIDKINILISKIKAKIFHLENPPERKQREKVEFKCESCDKKFKRAPIICPECEDDNITRLDQFT